MKRKKADPDRQQDFEKRQFVRKAERARQLVGAEHEKVEILEDAEQRQMHRDRDAENDSLAAVVAGPVDQQPGEVADRRAEREQKAEPPIPLGVKKIARDDEHGFFRRESSCRAPTIAAATTRKKIRNAEVGNSIGAQPRAPSSGSVPSIERSFPPRDPAPPTPLVAVGERRGKPSRVAAAPA